MKLLYNKPDDRKSHRARGNTSAIGKRSCLVVCAILSGASLLAAEFDVVIRNGRLIDGTGNPWVYSDLAIKGDRIAAVGRIPAGAGTREIDAKGHYVTPGFIDPHSHCWPAISRPATAAAKGLLTQGVTTALTNPDGGGPTDLVAQRRAIEAVNPGVNVALFIGHNSTRSSVMGRANRDPDAGELTRMAAIVRKGFEDGAFGLSAGPFYTPGNFSKTEEHIALARVAAEFDGVYTSHIRDESDYTIGVVAAVEEVIRIAREARLPGVVTHIKALGPNAWGKSVEIVKRIAVARADGVEVFADQYPYEASSTGLMAALVPAWALEGGSAALKARLLEPETRASIRREMVGNLARRNGASNIMISSFGPDKSIERKRLAEIARERLQDPVDVAIDLLIRGGATIISFNMNDDDIRRLMAQPWTMASSDGQLVEPGEANTHPRSYGPFPRKLRRYIIDGNVTTLEEAIRSMTGLTATVFRLRDRGYIRCGAYADVVVFDPATISDRATYEAPHQFSTGIRHVFVNGKLALTDGEMTNLRAGRVLKRQAP
jgi:N-acyl-D-amino-acid deacylase